MWVFLSTLGRYQTPLKNFDRDCGMLFIQRFVLVHQIFLETLWNQNNYLVGL